MQRRFLSWFGLPSLIAVLLVSSFVAFAATSTNGQFTATPNTLIINWTNSFTPNATINSPAGNDILVLNQSVNTTTIVLSPNYSQPTTGFAGQCSNLPIGSVVLPNGSDNGLSTVSLIPGASANFTLRFNRLSWTSCMPGRYFGSIYLQNATVPTENLSLGVKLDIPIVVNNTLSNSTGIGNFSGSIPANSTAYQSYYFLDDDVSAVNATSVAVSLSGWSSGQELDAFLLDGQGNLLASSVQPGTTSQRLVYNYLNATSPRTYEIRLAGNSTSSIGYTGFVYFSSLQAADLTAGGAQASPMSFGTANSTNVSTRVLQLRNNGTVPIGGLQEYREVFLPKRLTGTGPQNFTVLVPGSSIANRVRVSLTWTGQTNYTLNVTDPLGNSYGSQGTGFLANVSGVTREVDVDTQSIPSASGLWDIQAVSNATANDAYKVTVLTYVDPSGWISTNFTSVTFNATQAGFANSSENVQVNFTVPNDTLDGTYEGNITYNTSAGAALSAPFRVTVTSPELVVNNSLTNQTITVDQNPSSGPLVSRINVPISNNGSVGLAFDMSRSSVNLSCIAGDCGSNVVDFSYNSTGFLAANSQPGNSSVIQVSVNQNSTTQPGLYSGWILFNATNQTASLGSHPYPLTYLTIRLNVTTALRVSLFNITDADGGTNVASGHGTILVNAKVFSVNGTEVTDLNKGAANGSVVTDFPGLYLRDTNISSDDGRVPRTYNLTVMSGYTSVYNNSVYSLEAVVPSDMPGGAYSVTLYVAGGNDTQQLNGGSNYFGSATNSSFYLSSPGVLMSSDTTGCAVGQSCSASISLQQAESRDVIVNLTNVGLSAEGSPVINMNFTSCVEFNVTVPTNNCGGSSSVVNYSANVAGGSLGAFSSCNATFRITANFTGTGAACNVYVTGSPSGHFFNPSGLNFSVSVAANASSGSSSSGSSSNSATTATTTAAVSGTSNPVNYLDITGLSTVVEVGQGKTGSTVVAVKNTNDTVTQLVSLGVVNLNGTIASSVSPSASSVSPGDTIDYTVTFSVPADEAVASYPAKFQASSSQAVTSKDFSLHVLPGAAAKAQINSTLANLTAQYDALLAQVSAAKASGVNVSATEDLLSQLKSKLDSASSSIALGTDQGYFAASELFGDIGNLLTTSKAQLSVDQQNASPFSFFGGNILTYVGIGVAVAVVGILVYLFLPTKVPMSKLLAPGTKAKITNATSDAKGAADAQFNQLKDKFKLKKEYKYKYEE